MKKRIITLLILISSTGAFSGAKNLVAGKGCEMKCPNRVQQVDLNSAGTAPADDAILISRVHAVVLGI